MTTPYDTYKSAILGVPFDTNKKPSRQGAVKAFSEMQVQLEAAQSGALVSDTLVNANLMTNVPAVGTMLWVLNDTSANSGIYANEGTAAIPVFTTKLANIPQFVLTGVNTGVGTVDAIQATTDLAVPDEDGRSLIIVNIVGVNTIATPTVSFDAGVTNLTIKTNSGNNVAIGGLTAGMNLTGFISNSSTEFRLISDQASAAIQAACEAALDAMIEKSIGAFVDDAAADAFLTGLGLTKAQGTMYFNTTSTAWRYWDGDSWEPFPYATVADSAVTPAKLSTSIVPDYENSMPNGNFDSWLTGTSFSSGSNYDGPETWSVSPGSGGAVIALDRQAFAAGQTDVPGNPEYYAEFERTTTGTGNTIFRCKLPNLKRFSAQTRTDTFYIKGDSAFTPTARLTSYFGTGGSPSSSVNLAQQDVALTTSWQQFDLPFSIASVSGKTFGTNGDDELWIEFIWPIGEGHTGKISLARAGLIRDDISEMPGDHDGYRPPEAVSDSLQRYFRDLIYPLGADADYLEAAAEYSAHPYLGGYTPLMDISVGCLLNLPIRGDQTQGWRPNLFVRDYTSTNNAPFTANATPMEAEGTGKTYIGDGGVVRGVNDTSEFARDHIPMDTGTTPWTLYGIHPGTSSLARDYARAITDDPDNSDLADTLLRGNVNWTVSDITNSSGWILITNGLLADQAFELGDYVKLSGITPSDWNGVPFVVSDTLGTSAPDLYIQVHTTPRDIISITKAAPPVVTTKDDHGFVTGQTVDFGTVEGMTELDGYSGLLTVTGNKTFTLDGVDSNAYGTFNGSTGVDRGTVSGLIEPATLGWAGYSGSGSIRLTALHRGIWHYGKNSRQRVTEQIWALERDDTYADTGKFGGYVQFNPAPKDAGQGDTTSYSGGKFHWEGGIADATDATKTCFHLRINETWRAVRVGAADTGESGFRILQVAN